MIRLIRYILFVSIAGAAFWLGSCSKTQPKDFVEMDTDSSVIKHLNFMPGTYWIYNDLISGRTDSFYVRSNEYQPQSETYNIYNYHLITIAEVNVDGTNPGDSANWVFSYQGTRIMADYDYTVNAYGWKNQIQFAPLYMYPFQLGDMMGRNDSSFVTQVDTVFSVNGLVFRNVAHVYHHSDVDSSVAGANITKLDDWFYVNDSVGLVTMILSHPDHHINHFWQLVRYNIVKPQY